MVHETMSVEVEGIRVVRGPNWHYGDDDGGEGHVGTVTQDNEDDTVEVQWDMGNSGTYDSGNDGKCDLRVFDSAQLGWVHIGVTCVNCKVSDFPGTRWKCGTCNSVSLCTPCYFKDKHNIQHQFERIDAPGMSGKSVPKRSISYKQRSLGIFIGATVRRGVDWRSGNQDGGDGKIGTVLEVTNHGTAGQERDSVTVRWPNAEENRYRVGYKGKMDLLCVEQAPGMDFYRDHLLHMNTHNIPKKEAIRTVKTFTTDTDVKQTLQVGDKVCTFLPENAFKELQRGHGGWAMRMADYVGKHGEIKRFEDNGDVLVQYEDKEYIFNAKAVMKVPTVKLGDRVRINDNSDIVQALQTNHGGWQHEMQEVLDKVGKVLKIDSDGDIAVSFGNKSWVFNPACCHLAPEGRVLELPPDSDYSEGSGDRGYRAQTGASEAGAAGGAKGGDDDDDDDDDDEAPIGLGHLIAQLMLLRELGESDIGPQHLVGAAAKNDVSTVQRILKDKPSLLDQKHQGLTALIISSHEGNTDTVVALLNAGANTNLTEPKGNNALMAALMKKHETIALLILKVGTNINTANNSDRTALHFAVSNGCLNVLKQLLILDANPNLQDAAGDTPLHDAIHAKSSSVVSMLLSSSKINLKITNKKGHPPLHLAAMRDDESTVAKIVNKSPELINTRKEDGYTPLHVAAINDNTDVINTLLKLKAKVDPTDKNNITPLHLATHQGHLGATKLLVQASANVNIQDNDGDTPLHTCMMGKRSGGDSAVLAILLLGIRVSSDGEIKERMNVACFLIQNGAYVDIRNKRGRNALECCNDERMRNAIRMFAEKHGRQSSSARPRRQGGVTLADLFSELPLPCIRCMEEKACAKFGPCGHKVCCRACAFKVRNCPMCNTPIVERYGLDGAKLDPVKSCSVQ